MALEDQVRAQVRAAFLTAAVEVTVDALARRFLVKVHPFPGSEAISIDSAANLQGRPSTPDRDIPGLPKWGGVTDATIE